MSNKELQLEELETIEAIYPDNVIDKLANDTIFHLSIPQHEYIVLQISLPTEYPSTKSPNILEVKIDKLFSTKVQFDEKYLLTLLQEVMDSVFHKDNICLFDFISELDGILYIEENENIIDDFDDNPVNADSLVPLDPFEGWIASEPITDRRSTFIAYATHVNSEDEAFQKLEQIKQDSKMRKTHHIMSAWRIKSLDNDNVTFQDCDDDGETAAGSRMLHLITIMNVWNVMVIVARWYGGVHLGPDRFKHINSTAREAVLKAGFELKKN